MEETNLSIKVAITQSDSKSLITNSRKHAIKVLKETVKTKKKISLY
jgi:hypothetical protein